MFWLLFSFLFLGIFIFSLCLNMCFTKGCSTIYLANLRLTSFFALSQWGGAGRSDWRCDGRRRLQTPSRALQAARGKRRGRLGELGVKTWKASKTTGGWISYTPGGLLLPNRFFKCNRWLWVKTLFGTVLGLANPSIEFFFFKAQAGYSPGHPFWPMAMFFALS